MKQLFEFGQIVATSALVDRIEPGTAFSALARFGSGDWGIVDDHDAKVNEVALRHGFRLMGVYPVSEFADPGEVFWIITEADRSSTCFLLPEDY